MAPYSHYYASWAVIPVVWYSYDGYGSLSYAMLGRNALSLTQTALNAPIHHALNLL
jgi:hypothetical protein